MIDYEPDKVKQIERELCGFDALNVLSNGDVELPDDELEAETYADEKPEDEVYVMDGRGDMVRLEVPDDADD